MTLAARRRAKIVDKARGLETGQRNEGKGYAGKNRGGGGWYQGDTDEERPKGKGKKGKQGGKGNAWSGQSKESWKWKNYQDWQPRQENNKNEKGKEDKNKKEGSA